MNDSYFFSCNITQYLFAIILKLYFHSIITHSLPHLFVLRDWQLLENERINIDSTLDFCCGLADAAKGKRLIHEENIIVCPCFITVLGPDMNQVLSHEVTI